MSLEEYEYVKEDDATHMTKANALVGRDFECPFCADSGFDAAGLKSHIQNGECEVCEKVETIKRIRFW